MYGKKLVTNKQDILDFIKKIEEQIEEDISWNDEFLPDKFPSVMVIVVPKTRAPYFNVFWMHVWMEDFLQGVEEIN